MKLLNHELHEGNDCHIVESFSSTAMEYMQYIELTY